MREWQAVTDDLVAAVRAIDAAQLDQPSACGDWTNRQLLIHMATGYGVRISELQAVINRVGATAIDPDAANAANVARLADASADRIVAEMVQVRGRVLTLLALLRAEHLDMMWRLGHGKTLRESLAGLNAHDLEHSAQLPG